jgi:hypothetical protein
VNRLVRHCAGRVRYWQCDNEPCNVGLLWAGMAAQYVNQLQVLQRAVKDADSGAAVVLGGAPYGLPASAPGDPERQFFDVLLRDGRDFFDLLDLHLYGPADRVLADIEAARGMMRAFGYEKPLVVGEYNAPWPNLYPEATEAMEKALADAASAENPERAALAGLYEHMAAQPPQLQMFLRGCPPELEDKRHRINRREIVMRNLLALSAGVRRTACWNLAPDIPGYEDPLSAMDLLFGKLALLGYEGTELRRRNPSAEAFSLLAERLAGVDGVTRVEVPGRPGLMVFEVRRRGRGPLLVVWEQRDSFSGEDEPPVAFAWPWPAGAATAVDALGPVGAAGRAPRRPGGGPGVAHAAVRRRRLTRPSLRRRPG